MSQGHKSQPERATNGQSWNNLGNKINIVVSDYNPKYKISTHTDINDSINNQMRRRNKSSLQNSKQFMKILLFRRRSLVSSTSFERGLNLVNHFQRIE